LFNRLGGSVEVPITVGNYNEAPTAKITAKTSVKKGDLVTLDGSSSSDTETESTKLKYTWSFTTQPEGSLVNIINKEGVVASFVADKPGRYVVKLVVNDMVIGSAPVEVIINAEE
jgi:hypothetical protein